MASREMTIWEELEKLPIDENVKKRLLGKLDAAIDKALMEQDSPKTCSECKPDPASLISDLQKRNLLLLEQNDSLEVACMELSKALFRDRAIRRIGI